VAWKELAAQVDTQPLVRGLRSIEHKITKRQYKRLIATAVAELLQLHPKLGRRKARRWARKATGSRPFKRALQTASDRGIKEGLGAAAVAAAGAGAAKVVRTMARPLKRRSGGADPRTKEAGSDVAQPAH
jgi:hypothetical protein